MKVTKGSVVGLEYSLHLGDGQIIDSSTPEQPLSYIHGEGEIVPGLERAIEGMSAGESKQVVVQPEDGYGNHDPSGIQEVPKHAFPPNIVPEVGMQFTARGPHGEPVPFLVKELKGETVVIDMNHPLAGETLHFNVKITEVRLATPEDLERGHSHCCHAHEEHCHGGHGNCEGHGHEH